MHGFYLDGKTCLPCDPGCKTCVGLGGETNNCPSCFDGYYLEADGITCT